jgi:hypothetical protein
MKLDEEEQHEKGSNGGKRNETGSLKRAFARVSKDVDSLESAGYLWLDPSPNILDSWLVNQSRLPALSGLASCFSNGNLATSPSRASFIADYRTLIAILEYAIATWKYEKGELYERIGLVVIIQTKLWFSEAPIHTMEIRWSGAPSLLLMKKLNRIWNAITAPLGMALD